MSTYTQEIKRMYRARSFRMDLAIALIVLIAALLAHANGVDQQLRNIILGIPLTTAALYICLYICAGGIIPLLLLRVLAISLCFVVVYLISLAYSDNISGGLVITMQLLLLLSWFVFCGFVSWTSGAIRSVYLLSALFITMNFLIWCIGGFQTEHSGFISSKNAFAEMTLFCTFFLLCARSLDKHPIVQLTALPLLAVSIVSIWSSTSRSSQLGLLVSLAAYVAWPVISRRSSTHILTFIILVGIILGTIFVYNSVLEYDFYPILEEYIRTYTGGNLYSGRQRIWPILLDLIAERPLLGWGAGTVVGDFLGAHDVRLQGLSGHSLYLQVAVQTGLVGIAVLAFLLYSIWSSFRSSRNDTVVRWCAAFFLGGCVEQIFQVSLTQNYVSAGILFWTIMGIGIHRTIVFGSDQP